jgi:hypothetical protein
MKRHEPRFIASGRLAAETINGIAGQSPLPFAPGGDEGLGGKYGFLF